MARPRNLDVYSDASVFELAAAYGWGLAKNHVFVDGNKRVSLMAMYVFLAINGFTLQAAEDEAVKIILGISSGETDEKNLADCLEKHTTQQP